MTEQIIENYRIISTNQLVRAIGEVKNSSERFCFILGSGASASSNIPTGGELECRWMAEMEAAPGLMEIQEVAKALREAKRLDYDFEEINKAWQEAKKLGTPLPSKYYFDIYKLRFFPNHRNGYHYLEKVMSDAKPSFGYHPLALMLTEGSGNNLVITTNFDSLVEDALFLYTNSKPLVINHELLADFAGDPNISRPIVAKVHRGIFFDPLNRPEETNELKGKWHDVLVSVFQSYTPIVIGYGGGDNSLMELLTDENVIMRNGIYWCYVEEYGLPNEKIQMLVQQKKGYLVRTAGFDATMLAIGNSMFSNKIGVHETEKYLSNQTSMQIENYEKEYKKLTERKVINSTLRAEEKSNPSESENEFKKEIELMVSRGSASEHERQQSNQMTAWDYRRQGSRYYDSEQYNSAVKSYSEAISMQSNIAMFYNERACAYACLGEYESAISDCNSAIELNPDYANAYGNRGYVYSSLGEYEKAISDYNKAIEMNPDYAEAYNNRGGTYNNLGEYEKAILDFNKAILLKPNYANPYKHCGTSWKKKGDLVKAIDFYSKAIELNAQYKEAYVERADAYRMIGENEKAIADEAIAAKL